LTESYYEIPPPARHLHLPIISRIKILSKLDIAEKRLPQDGAFLVKIEERPIDITVLTGEVFRALIHYAWNLREDQIFIPEELNDAILRESFKLSQKFGQADDLPIVYPQDFRKTFARLCVAMAIASLSSSRGLRSVRPTIPPSCVRLWRKKETWPCIWCSEAPCKISPVPRGVPQ
jgi:hypothetical protein